MRSDYLLLGWNICKKHDNRGDRCISMLCERPCSSFAPSDVSLSNVNNQISLSNCYKLGISLKIKNIITIVTVLILLSIFGYKEIQKKIALKYIQTRSFQVSTISDLSGNFKRIDNDYFSDWINFILKESEISEDAPEKGELHPFVIVHFTTNDKYSVFVKVDTKRDKVYSHIYKSRGAPVLNLVYSEQNEEHTYEMWSQMINEIRNFDN